MLATKHPEKLKGHNNVNISPHWNTPKYQIEWRRPTDIYVLENGGFIALTIDLPLAGTRKTLDNDYVGTRVAFLYTGITFYGTMKCCFVGD